MARTGDLPRWLADVHPGTRCHHAEVALAVVVVVLVLTVVANVSALTQNPLQRRYPRALQVGGIGLRRPGRDPAAG